MKNKLNILMGKEGVTIDRVIRIRRGEEPEPVRIELDEGEFWYKEAQDKEPKWVKTFFEEELEGQNLKNKTIQAVYLVRCEVRENEFRVFALTFGLGRNLLNLDLFEENFGFITALNMMDVELIRSVDSNTISSNPRNNKVMLGKSSKITDFNVDIETNLLKSITGKLEENSFGDSSSATGKQSLSLSVTANYSNIVSLLPTLYERFMSDVYKSKFPGINHTQEIKDKQIINRLNERLLEDLHRIWDGEEVEYLVMTMPTFINEKHEAVTFKYSYNGEEKENLDVMELLEHIIPAEEEWDNDKVMNHLKNDHVRVINPQENNIESWKYYNCLLTEVNLNNHQYVLNDGKWYKYEDDYVQEVLTFYDNIPLADFPLPDLIKVERDNSLKWETEGEYNSRAVNCLNNAVNLDAKLVNPNNQSNFEVCDIFDKETRSFIHVKKDKGSAVLSHLGNQGFVSGDLMLQPAVRQNVVEKYNVMEEFLGDDYVASKFKIVFVIIDDKRNDDVRPRIPFFSKVTFRHNIQTLKNYGYSVQLQRVRYEREAEDI